MSIDSTSSFGLRGSASIDVVICTKDRPVELTRCIESILAQSWPADRILVIDAGAPTTSAIPEGVEVARSYPGLTVQRNKSLDLTRNDLVAFVDDDTELEQDYLKEVLACFAGKPNCVGVGGNIVNDPVRPLMSIWYRRVFALAEADGRLRLSGEANYLRHPAAPTRVDVLSGSNMVFRRDAVEGLRFDERFDGYGYMEDVDFCLQASIRGDLWAIPTARIVHSEAAVSRPTRETVVQQALTNGARIFAKHRASFGLSGVAFARRTIGRSIGYLGIACWRRSFGLVRGVVNGLRSIPAILAASDG